MRLTPILDYATAANIMKCNHSGVLQSVWAIRVIADASDRCIEDQGIIDKFLAHLHKKSKPPLPCRVADNVNDSR